jgi:hypothetical protein
MQTRKGAEDEFGAKFGLDQRPAILMGESTNLVLPIESDSSEQ